MRTCPNCGGRMEGDGYTKPFQCENFQPQPDQCLEPDSGPWHCGDEPDPDGDRDYPGPSPLIHARCAECDSQLNGNLKCPSCGAYHQW